MAAIAVTETDYQWLHAACIEAWKDGRHDEAQGLNRLGRKMNAALAAASLPKVENMGRLGKTPKVDGPLDQFLKEAASGR